MKKYLISGIVLLIICLGITIYEEIKKNSMINIYDITSRGLKTENAKVYLEATFIAGTITNDKDNGYYVIFGDGVQYIVYMNSQEANTINRYLLDNPDNSYHIEGVTKHIPQELEENGRKFIQEWLDNNHNHENGEEHDHNITVDDFYHYFGYIYLDTTINHNIWKIIIYVTGTLGVLLVIRFMISKYHIL